MSSKDTSPGSCSENTRAAASAIWRRRTAGSSRVLDLGRCSLTTASVPPPAERSPAGTDLHRAGRIGRCHLTHAGEVACDVVGRGDLQDEQPPGGEAARGAGAPARQPPPTWGAQDG